MNHRTLKIEFTDYCMNAICYGEFVAMRRGRTTRMNTQQLEDVFDIDL